MITDNSTRDAGPSWRSPQPSRSRRAAASDTPRITSWTSPRPVRAGTLARALSDHSWCASWDVPPYLCEGRVVYREEPHRVGFYDYHRWAIDPRTALTRLLADRIRASSLFESVTVAGQHRAGRLSAAR